MLKKGIEITDATLFIKSLQKAVEISNQDNLE